MKIKLLGAKNSGSTMVIFVSALTLLLSLGAIVVDVGDTLIEKQKLQNAIDSAALAAAQELPDVGKAEDAAYEYMELNGFKKEDLTISFSDYDMAITLKGNKDVSFYFARILGINGTTAYTAATAHFESIGEAFNYVLFSGSKSIGLIMNGADTYVEGSSHTNNYFTFNGSKFTLTGTCEASKSLIINGSNINVGSRVPDAPYIEMPDFSGIIKTQAEEYGQLYMGSKIFSSSYINVDYPIYVNGDVTINGSHFKGRGSIVATGNIIFNGSNLTEDTDDAVCFYSQNGNITVNGSNAVLDGLLYAPNGSISFNGSGQTINGRAVANSLLFNGSSLRVIGGTQELKSLPSNGVRLIK